MPDQLLQHTAYQLRFSVRTMDIFHKCLGNNSTWLGFEATEKWFGEQNTSL